MGRVFSALLITLLSASCFTVAFAAEDTLDKKVPRETLKNVQLKQNMVGYHPMQRKILWIQQRDLDNDPTPNLETSYLKVNPIIRNPERTAFGFIEEGKVVFKPFTDTLEQGITLVDTTNFQEAGSYHLYPFGQLWQRKKFPEYTTLTINPNVFQFVGQAATRALYTQRAGQTLLDGSIGFFQEAGHLSDAKHIGGWYEGSTFAQHTLSHALVIRTLLTMAEKNPNWAERRMDLAYPRSEDLVAGIPDILHEGRVGLRWLLSMQDIKTGAFHTGISATTPPENAQVKPEYDKQERKLLAPSQLATASATAVLAQAARVYKSYDPDLALDSLIAAKAGMNALLTNNAGRLSAVMPWQGEAEMLKGNVQTYHREGYWTTVPRNVVPYHIWALLEVGYTIEDEALIKRASFMWDEVTLEDISWRSPLWMLWHHPKLAQYVPPRAKEIWEREALQTLPWARVLETPFVSPYAFKDFPILPASNDAWVRHALLWMDAYDETKNTDYLNAALGVVNYLNGFNKWDSIMLSGNRKSTELPLQTYPCNTASKASKITIPGLMLKGVTPDFPPTLPFQDSSTLCQWTATHITWQAHLAELMFRLDQEMSPMTDVTLNANDKEIQTLRKYNELTDDELRRLDEQKQEKKEASPEKEPTSNVDQ